MGADVAQAGVRTMTATVVPVLGWQETMTTQHSVRRRRRMRLAAAALVGGMALTTGCSGALEGSSGGPAKGGSPSASGAGQGLVLGQPSPAEQEITRWDATGKFLITPRKVVEGTSEDLQELGEESKFAGQKVAWVYVEARHVGGKPVKGPMVMTNVGAETAGGSKATRLLVFLGDLSSRPKDCTDEDLESVFKEGESRTMCAPYLIPAGAKVEKVTYSQGFYKDPLAWKVP